MSTITGHEQIVSPASFEIVVCMYMNSMPWVGVKFGIYFTSVSLRSEALLAVIVCHSFMLPKLDLHCHCYLSLALIVSILLH